MNSSQLPEFQTPRLILRGVAKNDIPSIQKYFGNLDIIGELGHGVPWPYPENGAQQFVENVVLPNQGINQWSWGIFLKSNPYELIGVIGLFRVARPEHRGFWLAKHLWGKGIMTEACFPINDFAFDHLGFDKLVLTNALGNHSSRRIKEKNGAVFIEVRESKFVSPKYTQAEVWELTKEKWQQVRNQLQIEEIVHRETKAWNTKNRELLLSIFHPEMVWVWPTDSKKHDPITWTTFLGKFDQKRWSKIYDQWFIEFELIHNHRTVQKIELSKQNDGAFAVVDVDTLWKSKNGEVSHWHGRTCKTYTLASSGWKMIAQTGVLQYERQ